MEFLTQAHLTDAETALELRNRQLAYEAACEGIVVLKNEGVLPLRNKRLALYGPGAAYTIKGGTGSGEVNERHSVSVLEGMRDRGFIILSDNWLRQYELTYRSEREAYRKEKLRRLNPFSEGSLMSILCDNFRLPAGPVITREFLCDTDTCVYVLARQAGEGGDRKLEKGDYYLTDQERRAIATCAKHYEKFVLVINCGSGMDMEFLQQIPGIDAVVYLCQPGTQGGNALADILSGVVTPSGKLTDTWAKSYDQIPFGREYSYLNGNVKQEYYREGIYVGYRFFDSFRKQPAFPFGFGLSYTEFSLECTGVIVDGEVARLSVNVTNTGDAPGKEVVQLYLSAPEGKMHKEYQQLAAFAKTTLLQPGEKTTLTLTVPLRRFGSYRQGDNSFVLERGDYVLRMGNSSRHTQPVAVLQLPREVILSRHEAICQRKTPMMELRAPAREAETLPPVPVLVLEAETFTTITHSYETPPVCKDPRVRQLLKQLSPADMVDIVVGVGQLGGRHGFTLPGAVGNTTSRFWDMGLVNTPLCDGPAGLRLQSRSTVTATGKVKPVEMSMSMYEFIPKPIKALLQGDPKREIPLYQYTTAFPVATCLAQSWNTELMEAVGRGIYEEMKEFGCTYWLAPAMNIHRNPLCGRNFEYFSEDPFLTGALAAAITRGVQQETGYYVTIKHFACNNQEDNRTRSNSNLSQRTLREIYLKGFQMAVEAGAKSVMTSYNKINGVYTPNSYDLCTKVLRNEWGFEGVVMTDWYSTNPGQGDNALCMAAGNDMIMPGTFFNKQQILMALASGKLRHKDLCRCCANVIQANLQSNVQKRYGKKDT